MNKGIAVRVAAAIAAAVALGLLEASWTTPTAPGATQPMLGSAGIGVVLAIVCWPRLWWAPALGMLEELVQIFFGQLPPVRPTVYEALFTHWSASYTWFNLYPYLTFPLLGLLGEALYRRYGRRAGESLDHLRPRRSSEAV